MRWMVLAVAWLGMVGGPISAWAAELGLVRGIVASGERDSDRIWFKLLHVDQRFVLSSGPASEVAWHAIVASNRSGQTIAVRYDLDAGRIDNLTGEPTFDVRELVADGATHILPQVTATKAKVPPRAEAKLARGVALYNTGADASAMVAFDGALAEPGLPTAQMLLASKLRGRAGERLAYQLAPGPEHDALVVAAKRDFETWRRLEPNKPEPVLAIAGALDDLGAYDQAMAIYGEMEHRWPDDTFWPVIRMAGLHRKLGRDERALALLDDFATRDGPQEGMPFHYHRAWVLSKLGRDAEAVDEATEGLKWQPEYPWALARRACAQARLGRLEAALVDQDSLVALLDRALVEEPATASGRHDLARARAVVEELRSGLARPSPLDAPCSGYWRDDLVREPSPLLATAG